MELPVNYEELHWTERRVIREEYIKIQDGRCCHCGKLLSREPDRNVLQKKVNRSLFPPGFFDYPVHLHHDHNTGMTIGAIHNYCNAVLWEYHGE